MDSDPLNPVAYASDLADLQEETIVEYDLSPFLQEVSHPLLVPEIEEEDQEIDHLFMQEKGVLDSPIFDEYSDEGEQISFVDLKSSPPVYDNYESDVDEEQLCIEINHPETPTTDIQQSPSQISEPTCIVLEPGSAEDTKQSIINSEASIQSCSDLQASEGGSHDQQEDMQRLSDLQLKQQQEVFVFSLIDPFANYLESLSSLDVRAILSIEGWLSCSFEMHLCILWFPAFFVSKLRDVPISQMLVWLHWKHDFT
jgi:hypothetical protein